MNARGIIVQGDAVMELTLLKSKLHRATVTGANVDYEGSVTIDRDLMDAADILPFERVDIWDVTNGSRLSTYAVEGGRGSGVVCINGAAAHLIHAGDLVIIAVFARMSEAEAREWKPKLVFLDSRNRIVRTYSEIKPETLVSSLNLQ
jgi:aspartate 1-decarboxylase